MKFMQQQNQLNSGKMKTQSSDLFDPDSKTYMKTQKIHKIAQKSMKL